jgi:hypothetical protein|tara:strand:- start:71 stop:289 length:219 start_codon:yes stop_codon:yes gene_type:complete
MKGRKKEKIIPTVIVYKKPTGKKYWLTTTEEGIDQIISERKRKPVLPSNYEIIEIGMGESFIDVYKRKYNIK